uniref:Uncharacterized protein n=1 Tax=Populus trichocarpa TaxID=3694 RepID=A0A2K1XR19_POPTR
MDEGMQQFQQSLVELEKCCPTCLISSQSAKNLQSFVREKSLLISEKGVLADSISQRLLRSSVTLTDKPK